MCLSSSFEPIKDHDGNVIRLMGVTEDITEKHLAEEQKKKQTKFIKHERRWLNDAINNCKDGFALFDAEDKLTFCNNHYKNHMKKVRDILKPGITFEEIVRARVEFRWHESGEKTDEKIIQERFEQYCNPKGPIEQIFSEETTYQINEYRTANGGITIIRIDITYQKITESELRAARDELELRVENARLNCV